ncbi:GntR family transcriptional regulator [Micromonospora sp. NPDC048063]|uniref:GntR family transcriptional regulator n=1 Tax=Micromonospora sp. NPDC048063 TaxID=3364256 RepID=UPI003716E074
MPTLHYGQPRYRLIADELRERIQSGAIPPGALLPTESKLVIEFRASRGTIRQAISVLRQAGLISTEHGRGSSVKAPARNLEPEGVESHTRECLVAADTELAALFAVQVGAALIRTETVNRRHGVVDSVVRTYRPSDAG